MKWTAHFEDYTIKQFDDNGNEIKYKEVIDDIDNLKLFVIMDNEGNCYSYNLLTQEFKYNDDLLTNCRFNNPKFSYYRKCSLNLGNNVTYVVQCMGIESENEYCFIEIDQQTNQYRFSTN